ncbi:MAG TPA: hypothetical protein VHJ82_02455, partial [Actinomycetota bacterium]|nr:hypothetical protein [Actinomycetota bacterium]
MTLSFALTLAAQSLVGAAVGWIAGDYLLDRLRTDPRISERIGGPERALAAVVGLCLMAVALMVV